MMHFELFCLTEFERNSKVNLKSHLGVGWNAYVTKPLYCVLIGLPMKI